jgi:DMSO reductase anchor subunit
MHAATSVILFTVLSGAGFGHLVFLGLGDAATGWTAFLQFALAYALAAGGLIASTFHLGNPQRALKAFTQWRTSWLSREAWVSVATLVVMGLVGAAAVFLDARLPALGLIGALLALSTVLATSMIYAQLKTVPRWNSPLTPLHFLATALAGGAILAGRAQVAALILLVLAALQLAAWLAGDGRFAARGHSLATATGLGGLGRLRLFESPHTGANYLLNEFVHEVGRRHAVKLRAIALVAMCLVPAVLLMLLPTSPPALAVAFAVHLAGAFVSRWLFFAEAEHVVRLHYGRT